MNLTQLRPNVTELKIDGGLTILYSYGVPVACKWTNGITDSYSKTEKRWSATTSRHINEWINTAPCLIRSQYYFNTLAEGL